MTDSIAPRSSPSQVAMFAVGAAIRRHDLTPRQPGDIPRVGGASTSITRQGSGVDALIGQLADTLTAGCAAPLSPGSARQRPPGAGADSG